jgi:hypothetical protein
MGVFRIGIDVAIARVVGVAREQSIYFQVHAVGYATEMEERKLADLNWP